MLALVVLVLVGLTIAGLLEWASTDLSNVANYQAGNTNQASVDGAVNVAIAAARYNNQGKDCESNTTTAGYFADTAAGVPASANGVINLASSGTSADAAPKLNNVTVWCLMDGAPIAPSNGNGIGGGGNATPGSRVIYFYACPVAMASCSVTHPYLTANVTFADVYQGNTIDWGSTQTINSWIYANQ